MTCSWSDRCGLGEYGQPRCLVRAVTSHWGVMCAQKELAEPLVQIVTGSAPLEVEGAMPGERQVSTFICPIFKSGAQGVEPLQPSKHSIRTSPGLCTA